MQILKQGFKALNLVGLCLCHSDIYDPEGNTKREVFRNYLEPNGILDTLTIGQIMCLSQAVLNSDCAMYNRSAYLKLSNYFLTIYDSMDEDETLKKLI
ncbi:hypothetical protein Bca52824_073143 [Brassica carinata]|uniref:Uncharacterized protein n=1 Tax=Brassica carinata TaxID=52824 RepID=A0A8X7QEU1_BRACI|nr:hypothetical protein Bca52824_073143 [Brassica carinata]